ncbi:MAG: hypothetical protein IJB34_05225 [Clostridia bacterium]|nr:hypothetical protein [Clostridia bacterium]
MNAYKSDNKPPTEPKQKRFLLSGKLKEIILISALAFALLFASWKIFYTDEQTATPTSASQTETKVSRLLADIEGVGDASVMICETEEGVKSVVVVCEGANDLRVILNVREAVAAALGTNQNAVKVYLKKV